MVAGYLDGHERVRVVEDVLQEVAGLVLLAGGLGQVLKSMALTNNMLHEMKLASTTRVERMMRWQPEVSTIWIVTVLLVVAGLLLVWKRARTVEVGE